MKKPRKNKNLVLFLLLTFIILFVMYILLSEKYQIYIVCPINYFTGLYCPGCGVTRMFFEIFQGNFYEAFRYNPLVFILLPFLIFLFFDSIMSQLFKKSPIANKIPSKYLYTLVVILLIYGVMRNIDMFSFLKPGGRVL